MSHGAQVAPLIWRPKFRLNAAPKFLGRGDAQGCRSSGDAVPRLCEHRFAICRGFWVGPVFGVVGGSQYSTTDVLSYLHDIGETAKGSAVPRAAVYAITFFEKAGGVDERHRTHLDPLVPATADAIEDDLVKQNPTRGETRRLPFSGGRGLGIGRW